MSLNAKTGPDDGGDKIGVVTDGICVVTAGDWSTDWKCSGAEGMIGTSLIWSLNSYLACSSSS